MGGGGAPEPPGPPGAAAACEQDRFLPIANISRIMKKALPGNAKIAKDAKVRPAPPPRRAGAVRLPPRLARTVPLPLLHLPSSGWRPDSAPLRSAAAAGPPSPPSPAEPAEVFTAFSAALPCRRTTTSPRPRRRSRSPSAAAAPPSPPRGRRRAAPPATPPVPPAAPDLGPGAPAACAQETVQECVSEFISFVTSEASDKCQREKRKTVNGDDLMFALSTLEFDS